MHSDVLLVLVVGTALAFDFTNGFHDTANVVATSISTRALPPRIAIGLASLLNFAGAFISLAVAATVASGIVDPGVVTVEPSIVFSGLIGAITWNVVTWYYGLPSSSSHALIGGVVGATFAAQGSKAVLSDGLVGKVVVPAVVAPILAFVVAGVSILPRYPSVGRPRPGPAGAGDRRRGLRAHTRLRRQQRGRPRGGRGADPVRHDGPLRAPPAARLAPHRGR